MANTLTLHSTKFNVGDLIRLHLRVLEGDKERIQAFEGLVISIRGEQENKTFTIRKIASGNIGVERIFPANSPWITKVEVKKTGRVRRAKLTYVRHQSVRAVAQITKAK
jgi:large subunit ribosomal protein L19